VTRTTSIDIRLKEWATTDRQREYIDAVNEHGGVKVAAAAMGIDYQTISRSVSILKDRAAQDGYTSKGSRPRKVATFSRSSRFGRKILVLPDVQAKPGSDFSYLMRIGQYIVEKQPDVIVCIGDFADLPSLSSYDKGKKSFEGRRYKRDIEAAKEAMSALLTPMVDYNAAHPKRQYKPRMVLTLGNHEDRIRRAIEEDAKLDGVMSVADLQYEDFGWEVVPFLQVIVIDGVAFSHYFTTGLMGRPASTAAAQLRKTNMSCVSGHQQGKQIAYGYRADGSTITSIVAGSCYEHDEGYLGPQGNKHWRGCVMLHEVREGAFDEMWISLGFINQRYPHIHVAPDFSKEHEPVPQPEGMR
jgi:hypothetical protein